MSIPGEFSASAIRGLVDPAASFQQGREERMVRSLGILSPSPRAVEDNVRAWCPLGCVVRVSVRSWFRRRSRSTRPRSAPGRSSRPTPGLGRPIRPLDRVRISSRADWDQGHRVAFTCVPWRVRKDSRDSLPNLTRTSAAHHPRDVTRPAGAGRGVPPGYWGYQYPGGALAARETSRKSTLRSLFELVREYGFFGTSRRLSGWSYRLPFRSSTRYPSTQRPTGEGLSVLGGRRDSNLERCPTSGSINRPHSAAMRRLPW